jgi:DNA polymerase-3 subunit beta
MKLSIEKGQLSQALTVVSKGMSSRTTMPILSGILLLVDERNLILRTTDLETSIQHQTAALIESQGEVVVPGKLFQDIVRSLPDGAIELEVVPDGFKVSCQDNEFILQTYNPIDYPSFPKVDGSKRITLPAEVLTRATKKVSKAVSRDESRATLTGVLIKSESGKVSFVATDSYRLSVVSEIESNSEDFELLVPGAVLEEVAKQIGDSKEVEISESENQIIFTFPDSIFISRKIEGKFPNYQALIPQEQQIQATINTENLLAAIKRVSIVSQGHGPIRFSFDAEGQNIEVSAQTVDLASASAVIDAEIEGESLTIGFNHQYISDGLNVVDNSEVVFEGQGALKPGILKSNKNEEFLYLTMPVRIDN